MNKILLGYLCTGPTFKQRIIENIKKFPSYKYFDVLILTDDPEYFNEIESYSNIIIKDLNKYREQYPEFLPFEVLPTEKQDETKYKQEICSNGVKYPLHLQRFILKYENIDKYKFITLADCDMSPIHNDFDFEQMMNYLENDISFNSISSNRCYYEYKELNIIDFTKLMADELNKDIDLSYPLNSFDGPLKIYKFESKEKIDEFFNTWNYILYNILTKHDTLIKGSWNMLSEEILAVIYRLTNIKVNSRDIDYDSLKLIRSFTYPEDRFWNDVSCRGMNTDVNTKNEFIEKNYNELKHFYIDHDQQFPY
jgi:hypothetical protein